MGACLDPEFQCAVVGCFCAGVAFGDFGAAAVVGDDAGAEGFQLELLLDVEGVVVVELGLHFHFVVDAEHGEDVFFKGIEEVEGIEGGKGDGCDVAVYDFSACDAVAFQQLARGFDESAALLYAGEVALGGGGADGAEFSGAAADIKDASSGCFHEHLRGHLTDIKRGPVAGGLLVNVLWIVAVEFVILESGQEFGVGLDGWSRVLGGEASGHEGCQGREFG